MKFSTEFFPKGCTLCGAKPSSPVELLPDTSPIHCCEYHRSELQRRYATSPAAKAKSLATRQSKARDSHYAALEVISRADAYDMSLKAQAELLNQAGRSTSSGGSYSATAVMRMYQSMATWFEVEEVDDKERRRLVMEAYRSPHL